MKTVVSLFVLIFVSDFIEFLPSTDAVFVDPKFQEYLEDYDPPHIQYNIGKYLKLMTTMDLMQNGWTNFRGQWYKYFDKQSTWTTSENFCRQMSGHLPSIKDDQENAFIYNLAYGNSVWIGLNKINSSNNLYEWTDGTPVDYLNWASTQPNEPHVDCAKLGSIDKDASWYDHACSSDVKYAFICKLKL